MVAYEHLSPETGDATTRRVRTFKSLTREQSQALGHLRMSSGHLCSLHLLCLLLSVLTLAPKRNSTRPATRPLRSGPLSKSFLDDPAGFPINVQCLCQRHFTHSAERESRAKSSRALDTSFSISQPSEKKHVALPLNRVELWIRDPRSERAIVAAQRVLCVVALDRPFPRWAMLSLGQSCLHRR